MALKELKGATYIELVSWKKEEKKALFMKQIKAGGKGNKEDTDRWAAPEKETKKKIMHT